MARHLDFYACVTAAVEAQSWQLPLVSFSCSKCEAIHRDLVRHAIYLHAVYNCSACGHHCSEVPKVCGNPPAAMGCSLVDDILYIILADG